MFDFLMIFSRFEYALKASGFIFGNENRVIVDWNKFVTLIKDKFDENKNKNDQLSKAVDYIIENPPKVQIVKNKELDWKKRNFNSDLLEINKLCYSIKGIRNNFFHGSKLNSKYQINNPRNYDLLKNAIIIMEAWLDLNDTVRRNFLEAIS